jgi:hypothetical protein
MSKVFNGRCAVCLGMACVCMYAAAKHDDHCGELKRPAFCSAVLPELTHGSHSDHRGVWVRLSSVVESTTSSSGAELTNGTYSSNPRWIVLK